MKTTLLLAIVLAAFVYAGATLDRGDLWTPQAAIQCKNHRSLQAYWVTVELERGRTADRRITARSPWAARWLYTQLHPAETVLMVRPVK